MLLNTEHGIGVYIQWISVPLKNCVLRDCVKFTCRVLKVFRKAPYAVRASVRRAIKKLSLLKMFSAEPGRKKAYQEDLRWRIVYQKIALNYNFCKIAKHLNVSTATAYRVYKLFSDSGNVDRKTRGDSVLRTKLDHHDELFVIVTVLENPSIYIEEVCKIIQSNLGKDVSTATICRLMRRYGITRKKIRQVAKQRCDRLRGAFMAQCFLFRSRNMFVWVDETGSDKRDNIRKYGYALRGVTPTYKRLLARGQRINAIAAISSEGVVATELITGTVNGDRFYDFLRGTLIPLMLPFNGINSHSVLIMDNCAVHHASKVRQLVQSAGIVSLFLPPYSPDLNPIEEAFSNVKKYLRKHDELLQAVQDPTDVIKAAFDSITAEQCTAWISHSGYMEY